MSITEALCNAVWDNYRERVCYCCQTEELSELNFSCGFLVSVKNGGKHTLKNLRPICSRCDSLLRISGENIAEFQERLRFSQPEFRKKTDLLELLIQKFSRFSS
jgi:hypothetical protein